MNPNPQPPQQPPWPVPQPQPWQPYQQSRDWPKHGPGTQFYPRKMVTTKRLNPIESVFHLCMTVLTMGLWAFVWVRRKRSITKIKG